MSLLPALARIRWLYIPLPAAEVAHKKRIDAVCPGWSGRVQWRTFRALLGSNPHIRRICMLGVYMGRDIAYLSAAFADLHRDDYQITGVDLFADVPGKDWPESKRSLTWVEAGYGMPPSQQRAHDNLATLGYARNVELVQSSAAEFLATTSASFDLIYIDVAHDYRTTKESIDLARPKLTDGGILAGDDYSDLGTWGVARAVREECPKHKVHYGWIWVDKAKDSGVLAAGDRS